MNHIEFFRGLARILEEMFPQGWFLEAGPRTRQHPAYVQWALCQKILSQGGTIHSAEQWDDLPKVARLMLDTFSFVILTGGNLDRLGIGSFDQIGDESVQRKIRSRVGDSRLYLDLLPELYVHAWHKQEGHQVNAMEREGWPDMRVDIPGASVPIFIECKRLQSISRTRFDDDIKKANRQIRAAKAAVGIPSCGVAVLDISPTCTLEWIGPPNKNSGDTAREDPNEPKIPENATRFGSLAVTGKNTFVDYVFLVWNDFARWGTPPNRTYFVLRRHVEYVKHLAPANLLSETLPLFKGHTAEFWINWTHTR